MHHVDQPVTPELAQKAKLIKDSPLFTHTFMVGANHLMEKQQLFLTLAQIKPVSFISAAHRNGSGLLDTKADDQAEVAAFLDQLGLSHSITGDEYETQVVVSSDRKLIDEYLKADGDNEQQGKLLGYPLTAVLGSLDGKWRDDEGELLKAKGLGGFPFFRLSQEHYDEELERIEDWKRILEVYGLA